MVNKEKKVEIFLAPTSTHHFMQFFVKFEGDEYKKYEDSKFLRENLDSLFKSLSKKDVDSSNKDLWIPSFSFSCLHSSAEKLIGDLEDSPKVNSIFWSKIIRFCLFCNWR